MEKAQKEHLYFLIMSGGGGTRLWPISRQKTPKQFIKIIGEESVFTQSVRTLKNLTTSDKIYAITNADYVDEVVEQGNLSLRNIIAEPQKKNTALAMAVGAAIIAKTDPDAIIINFPGDNLVFPFEKFKDDILSLAGFVEKNNCLALVGTKPTFPNTGYGYVRVSDTNEDFNGSNFFKILEFKEKPDVATAEKFVADGHYFWNAAFYTWKASSLLQACKTYAPKVYENAILIQKAWGTKDEQEVIRQVYQEAEDLSIDYAVSEKADNLFLIQSTFTWNDLGDWKEVWEFSKKDERENVILNSQDNNHTEEESSRNLVWTDKRFVSLVGVNDLIVVDTPDALLICHKDKVQDVKKVVNLLKEQGKKELS